jgi:N-acetyltransferase
MYDLTPFDLQPTLMGPALTLRPLRPEDFDALYDAASDPLIWIQHPEPTRHQRPVFERYFQGALDSKGALAVIERASGRMIGASRYYEWNEATREVAIGFTFLARAFWGGVANAEMKQLMLNHAFRWARTVWFHVGAGNHRSQRALEKIGARLSHQGVRDLGGVPHDYLFYQVVAR